MWSQLLSANTSKKLSGFYRATIALVSTQNAPGDYDPGCPSSVCFHTEVWVSSPWLGFRPAFYVLKVYSWAWPTCPQMEFGIHLVLGKCLGFSISCFFHFFLFFNGICHQRHIGKPDSWVQSWVSEMFFLSGWASGLGVFPLMWWALQFSILLPEFSDEHSRLHVCRLFTPSLKKIN